MKKNANDLLNESILEGDICIIGAGAAGITLARELGQGNVDIILLEAGDYEYSESSQEFYNGAKVVTDPPLVFKDDYPSWSRMRFFGGSTNHWGGYCRPLEDIDFVMRPWLPGSGWPFSREELAPYYEQAAGLVQIKPFDLKNEGRSFLGDNEPGHEQLFPKPLANPEVLPRFFYFSPPTNFGLMYRQELWTSPKITVVTNASIVRMEKAPNAEKIDFVVAKNQKGDDITVKAKNFILACGGLENPRLLLNFGLKNSAVIANQNDLMGRFYMDHPTTSFGLFLNIKGLDWMKTFLDLAIDKPKRIFTTSPEFQKKNQTFNFSCELDKVSKPPNETEKIRQIISYLGSSTNRDTYLRLVCRSEMEPQAQNRVTLSSEKDRFGLQKLNLSIHYSENDRLTIKKSTEALIRFLSYQGMGRGRLAVPSEELWNSDLDGGCHHMGTTRMDNDPKKGVVDAQGKVHGIDNLYVGGSSVFPTGGFANPTLTIVALALRLASHLKKRMES